MSKDDFSLDGTSGRPGDPLDDPKAREIDYRYVPPADDDDSLDIDHHERVRRVSECDSKRARKRSAEAEMARLVEEESALQAQYRDLGGNEHIDAIMRSGWFPYAGSILSSAPTIPPRGATAPLR